MPLQDNARWILPPPITEEINTALDQYPFLVRQILFNRGITTSEEADKFLRADSILFNPFELKNIDRAVEIIHNAVLAKKKIIVFGDYDVDGVTSSALLVQVLKHYGANVDVYIPNRFDEGYGLSMDALHEVFNDKPDLIITVDCGVRSISEVQFATDQGVEVIITDHHQPHEKIPEANAVICPRQPGDEYPNKNLAGVGIAYKVAQALLEKFPIPNVCVDNWIDLVALGTISDLAPLDGENRTLVRKGLRAMRFGKHPGLLALANVSGTNINKIISQDIGFRIGPRLNAAGRLGSAKFAFEILLAKTTTEAGELALKLDEKNRERQRITKHMQESIEGRYDPEKNKWMLFFWDKEFNEGVVGLAASRLVEKYYRPTIVGALHGNLVRASCRSIPQLNITSALDECEDLLVRHGGHKMAAGLTIKKDRIDEFTKRFSNICERELSSIVMEKSLLRELNAEADVNFLDLQPDLFKFYDVLEPIGNGNPMPLFIARGVHCRGIRRIGKTGDHLRLTVTDGTLNFDAVAFGFGKYDEDLKSIEKFDILFAYELNAYNGRTSLQLRIVDFDLVGTKIH